MKQAVDEFITANDQIPCRNHRRVYHGRYVGFEDGLERKQNRTMQWFRWDPAITSMMWPVRYGSNGFIFHSG